MTESIESIYINNGELSFGYCIHVMKSYPGVSAFRSGWNGKNLRIKMQLPDANSANTLPYLYIIYPKGSDAHPDGARVPWVPSPTDILADDWSLEGLSPIEGQ